VLVPGVDSCHPDPAQAPVDCDDDGGDDDRDGSTFRLLPQLLLPIDQNPTDDRS
jgi:hypothetical protein